MVGRECQSIGRFVAAAAAWRRCVDGVGVLPGEVTSSNDLKVGRTAHVDAPA
jgi:hypothetical protein